MLSHEGVYVNCRQHDDNELYSLYSQLSELIDSVLQYQGSPYEFEPQLDVS